MKIRNGFVSNSSSSSFIIGRQFLTKEQISKLKELYNKDSANNKIYDDNGTIFDVSKNYVYFTGRVNGQGESEFFKYLYSLNLSDEVLYNIES